MHGRFRRRGLGRRAGRPAETARRPGPQSQDHHRPARRHAACPPELRNEQRQALVQGRARRQARCLGLCLSGISRAEVKMAPATAARARLYRAARPRRSGITPPRSVRHRRAVVAGDGPRTSRRSTRSGYPQPRSGSPAWPWDGCALNRPGFTGE